MNDIQILGFDGQVVRSFVIEGDPYFVANGIARLLGYKNVSDATNTHCKKPQMVWGSDSLGRQQQFKVVPESDVYRLAFKSNMPGAEALVTWVTEEVVPNIRKHGAYMTPDTIEKTLSNPDFIIELATTLKNERLKVKQLEVVNSKLVVENTRMQPKAEYFDDLVDADGLTNFRDTAKMLGQKQNEFVDWLISKKYVYRGSGDKLLPYAQYEGSYFKMKERTNKKTSWVGSQTMITIRGREHFNRLLNRN